MNYQPLNYIYKASGNPDAYTVLLLHGTGGNEKDLLPLASHFGNSFNILSLRGNVTENGMPRFFKRLGMGVFDEDDLHFRTDEMVAFIKELAKKEGFSLHKIIALGYSNGANIAGAALLKYPGFLAGAILYRPMQPFKNFPTQNNAAQVPVFFSSGKADPTVKAVDNDKYIDLLKDEGFRLSVHKLNAGHNLVQEDIELTADWLQSNFAS